MEKPRINKRELERALNRLRLDAKQAMIIEPEQMTELYDLGYEVFARFFEITEEPIASKKILFYNSTK